MTSSPFRSRVALSLLLVTVMTTPASWAGATASFSGRVFEADGRTPNPGAIVTLVDATGEPRHRALPTRRDGAFVIADAASGSYRLLIETSSGNFLAPDAVSLAPGANPPVALAIRSGGTNAALEHGLGKTGQLTRWAKWLIAGGIAVGGLLLVNEVSDSESSASDF